MEAKLYARMEEMINGMTKLTESINSLVLTEKETLTNLMEDNVKFQNTIANLNLSKPRQPKQESSLGDIQNGAFTSFNDDAEGTKRQQIAIDRDDEILDDQLYSTQSNESGETNSTEIGFSALEGFNFTKLVTPPTSPVIPSFNFNTQNFLTKLSNPEKTPEKDTSQASLPSFAALPLFGFNKPITPSSTPSFPNVFDSTTSQIKPLIFDNPATTSENIFGENTFSEFLKNVKSPMAPCFQQTGTSDMFSQPIQSIFGNTSTAANVENDEDTAGNYSFAQNYEPIVNLATVETKTGIENDVVLFKGHCKAYRYHNTLNEYRLCGTGLLQVLYSEEIGHTRVVMHRDTLLTVCINHWITENSNVPEIKGKANSVTWDAMNQTTEEAQFQVLCARFPTGEEAQTFITVFKNATESCKGNN